MLTPEKSHPGWPLCYYMFKGLTIWPGQSDRNFSLLIYVFSLLTDFSPGEDNHFHIPQALSQDSTIQMHQAFKLLDYQLPTHTSKSSYFAILRETLSSN